MTTKFQHGTKPTYDATKPRTLDLSLRQFASRRRCDNEALETLIHKLNHKLSNDGINEPFDARQEAVTMLGPLYQNVHDRTHLVDFIHAILEQAVYGFGKYGTVLQPNDPNAPVLDFYEEALLELADFYQYAINLKVEGRTEDVKKLIRVVEAVTETLRYGNIGKGYLNKG